MIGEWNERAARDLIDQLIQQGVTYFCSAPGFRSTPLALAAAEHPRAKLFIHFDERGLGFHALGYAKATGKPAALIVTSGTAVGNLYPAVMEAAHSNLPLIILTADRPPELRDVHANQACDQIKFFGSYVRYHFDLPTPSPERPNRFLATTVAQAVYRSKDGPVHLNCAFSEPFLGQQPASFEPTIPCDYEKPEITASEASLKKWAALLNGAEKGAIVVGALRTPHEYAPLFELAEKLQWPILGDILSGLRSLGSQNSVVRYWETILKNEKDLQPDVILHLGEQCVSKKLLQWSEAPILHVSSHAERCDPKHQVTHRVICDPMRMCKQILPYLTKCTKGWLREWKECEIQLEGAIQSFFSKEGKLSEPGLFKALPASFPALYIGNSMPIRDADRFFFPQTPTGPIFANRGLSGIDGNIATCAGIATSTPLIAIMGDQTALHDLNSLAMLKKSVHPVTLIIINNGGGGIFSFVSVPPKEKIAEEVFAAAHNWTFEKAAALFDIPYSHVERPSELTALLGETRIIEITTTRSENLALHRDLDLCLSSCMVS